MNITVLSQYCGSEFHGMAYGSYYLAKEWVRQGNQVTVISASYSHARHSQPAQPRWLYRKESVGGVNFIWLRTIAHSPKNTYARLVNIVLFIVLASILALFRRARGGLLICTSHHPLAIVPARIFSVIGRMKLVYEVRDLWVEALIQMARRSRHHPIYKVSLFFEKMAFRKAEYIVSVLPKLDRYLKQIGVERDFIYIPNGISPCEITSLEHRRELAKCIEAIKTCGDSLIVYAGNLGRMNCLAELIKAMELLRNRPVQLVMVGEGMMEGWLRAAIEKKGLSGRVHIYPSLLRSEVQSLLKAADFTYVGYENFPMYRYGISPTKVNDYLFAAKPVLFLSDFDLAELEDCQGIMKCSDIESLAASICMLISSPELVEKMGKEAYNWAVRYRTYDRLAAKFLVECDC